MASSILTLHCTICNLNTTDTLCKVTPWSDKCPNDNLRSKPHPQEGFEIDPGVDVADTRVPVAS